MTKPRAKKQSKIKICSTSITIRLDEKSKAIVRDAAKLRGITVSDYVKLVVVPQAHREIAASRQRIIALTPDEQHAFWALLNRPPKLTAAQRKLGAVMRGEN